MKKLILLPLLFCFGIISAQELEGAWKLIQKNGEAVNDREVIKIVQDGFFVRVVQVKAPDGHGYDLGPGRLNGGYHFAH